MSNQLTINVTIVIDFLQHTEHSNKAVANYLLLRQKTIPDRPKLSSSCYTDKCDQFLQIIVHGFLLLSITIAMVVGLWWLAVVFKINSYHNQEENSTRSHYFTPSYLQCSSWILQPSVILHTQMYYVKTLNIFWILFYRRKDL